MELDHHLRHSVVLGVVLIMVVTRKHVKNSCYTTSLNDVCLFQNGRNCGNLHAKDVFRQTYIELSSVNSAHVTSVLVDYVTTFLCMNFKHHNDNAFTDEAIRMNGVLSMRRRNWVLCCQTYIRSFLVFNEVALGAVKITPR